MKYKRFMLLIVMLLIVSCATFGIKTPETTVEKLNVSAATLTGLNNIVTANLKAGLIPVVEAEKYFVEATKAREALRTARILLTTGAESDVLAQWITINNLLVELNRQYNKTGGVQ